MKATEAEGFYIGQVLKITRKFKRVTAYPPNQHLLDFKQALRAWESVKINEALVVVVGIRNLTDGVCETIDGSNFYTATNTVRALLVTEGIYRKPFLIPIP